MSQQPHRTHPSAPTIEPAAPAATQVTLLTSGLYSLMFAFAMSVTVIGPLMPEIINTYSLRLSQGGLIMTAQSIGGILAIVGGGLVADKLHKGYLVASSFLAYVVSLFLIATAPMYTVLLAMFFILGASTRFLDTVNNALTADLHPHRRGAALNLLHTCFAVGALFGSLITRLLPADTHWSNAYSLLGFICLVLLAFFLFALHRQPVPTHESAGLSRLSPRILLRSGQMWRLCLVMILYVGHQSGLVVWLPMFLQEFVKASPFLGSLALAALWVGIMVGRFLCARLIHRLAAASMIAYGSLGGGALLLLSFALGHPVLIVACVGVTGLLTGAVIPLLVVIGCDLFPHNSGTASAMIFLSGSLSTMVFPWLMGWTAEMIGFRWSISITSYTLLGAFLLCLPLLRGAPTQERAEQS